MSGAVELEARITSYLSLGGLFNPEMANHDAVRDLLIDCRAEFATLRADNERLGLERDADIDALHGTFSKPIAVLQERVEAAEAERDTLIAQVEKMRSALVKANDRLPGIETPMMGGDNLAILLCSIFDDGDDEDDTGWSKRARDGYQEVIEAIRSHYRAALTKEPS